MVSKMGLQLYSSTRSCFNDRSNIEIILDNQSSVAYYLASLLIKSPKPGVSTTLSFRRTPFTSISVIRIWIPTVFGLSSESATCSLGGLRGALNRVLTRVDFPRPDSPTGQRIYINI